VDSAISVAHAVRLLVSLREFPLEEPVGVRLSTAHSDRFQGAHHDSTQLPGHRLCYFKTMKLTRSPNAFTLPEFMVVITVLGILTLLFLPAHASGRNKSQRILCIHNLKQLGISFRLIDQAPGSAADLRRQWTNASQYLRTPCIERLVTSRCRTAACNSSPANDWAKASRPAASLLSLSSNQAMPRIEASPL
jgi:prepilin-type N-terminal cleavage/methylation domain-containing protein